MILKINVTKCHIAMGNIFMRTKPCVPEMGIDLTDQVGAYNL